MKTLTRTYVLCLPAVICFCIAAALAQSKPSAPAVRAEMIVSTDWLAKHLSDKNIFVLHVARERKAYDDGHIPSARFIALGDLLTTREGVANELPPVEQLQKLFEAAGIGDEGRIVIYGENNGLAAARAFFTLDYLGHGARAALLDGGLEKWKLKSANCKPKPQASPPQNSRRARNPACSSNSTPCAICRGWRRMCRTRELRSLMLALKNNTPAQPTRAPAIFPARPMCFG
ncbi:MAG TPA: rhodanese-like domain-containing protein [Blastocatellia bacterium]|nr:rhodanese-like domain-containing protein [Blastocatellia bacterium]